jgi:hypothetical protein
MPDESISGMGKIADFFGEEGIGKKWWNSPKTGVPLWIGAASFTIYWLYCVPPPGYAIGLLAVVAGIMSVRDIKTIGKIWWVILLICLLITEFRAIGKDRAENQQQQREFFDAQKKGFSDIADQARQNFDVTADGLHTAIEGLNQTLVQTAPRALFGRPAVDMGKGFFTLGSHQYNVKATNVGNDTASNVYTFARIYLGKPDDASTQLTLAEKFEEDWRHRGYQRPASVPPFSYSFVTEQSPAFGMEDIKSINAENKTMYVFTRTAYSDRTGSWYADACSDVQLPLKGAIVVHFCPIETSSRHKPK